MNLRHLASCGLVCAAILLSGCDQGRQTPAKVNLRVINAAPGFAELGFQREQDNRNLTALQFLTAQEFPYDADTYDFFVFERSYAGSPGRTWTFAPTLEAEKSYTVVLTEVGTEVRPVVLERAAAAPADAEIEVLHAADGSPAMDLYLERPGVGIGGATPRGTLTPGGQLSARALPSGDYELWLTAAGNPANVLLATNTISLPAGNTTSLVISPEGNLGTAPFSVIYVGAGQTVLYNRNATTEIRVLNAATDRAPRDFAVNSVFTPPLFSATPFGLPTPYAAVPLVANIPINVTPVGNPGVLELNQTFTGFLGARATILFGGPTGALTHATVADDGRRFHNEAKLRFFNAASQFTAGLDLLIGNAGDDPAVLPSAVSLVAMTGAAYLPLGPGDYDLYLRQFATTTIVAGPTRVNVDAGGIYGILATDGPDATTAGMVLFDDFR
jgi:hypothetical protein